MRVARHPDKVRHLAPATNYRLPLPVALPALSVGAHHDRYRQPLCWPSSLEATTGPARPKTHHDCVALGCGVAHASASGVSSTSGSGHGAARPRCGPVWPTPPRWWPATWGQQTSLIRDIPSNSCLPIVMPRFLRARSWSEKGCRGKPVHRCGQAARARDADCVLVGPAGLHALRWPGRSTAATTP